MKKLILILIYSIFWRNFFKIIIGLRYYNSSILKDKKQFILIANHNSHMDTMAIMSAIPMKYIHKVHPIAADDFFGGNQIKEFLMRYLVNATLIPRKKADNDEEIDPVKVMSNLLRKKRSIILYPEGSRGEAGVVSDFKKGIAYLIKENPQVNVIPVYLDKLYKTLPKGKRIILPYNCKIVFGDKISFNSHDISEIVNNCKQAINDLKFRF